MVAKLTALDGPLKGLVLSLEKREEWILGRDPQSSHIVVEDPKIDRRQLLLRNDKGQISIENLSETVALFVNDQQLAQPQILLPGDKIRIGDTLFEFQLGAENQPLETTSDDVFVFGKEPIYEETKKRITDFTDENDNYLAGDKEGFELEDISKEEEDQPEEGEPLEDQDSKDENEEAFTEDSELENNAEESLPQEPEFEENEDSKSENKKQEPEFEENNQENSFDSEEPKLEENAEDSESSDSETESFDIEKPKTDQPETQSSEIVDFEQPAEVNLEALESEEDTIVAEEQEFNLENLEGPTADEQEFNLKNLEGPTAEEQEHSFIDENDFEEKPFQASEGEYEEPIFDILDESAEEELDLAPSVRFLLKIISGPNSGAEFALTEGENYVIGTDTTSCDVVLHDLSVSREHAKLSLSEDGELAIEDLDSRNGVLIDQQEVTEKTPFAPNSVLTLGTTSFFVLDREAPQETIIAPSFDFQEKEEETSAHKEEKSEKTPSEPEEKKEKKKKPVAAKKIAPEGSKIFSTMVIGLAVVIGLGILSLWNVKEIDSPPSDYLAEIQESIRDFPGVKYTYSKVTRRLFLLGHVASGVEKNELLYKLESLTFLRGIEDNVVNNEAVWQEMNSLLSKEEMFSGVSMHSPRPGLFVLRGYLKTEDQAAALNDYMNIHFNFIDLLENRVVVEEQIKKQITSQLIQNGFGSVVVSFLNGELVVAGYVGANQEKIFDQLLLEFKNIHGVRQLRNFVVIVSPEQEVIDLNLRYPGKYTVTGFSKHGDVSINVVVNGKILSRGDELDGMTITSLQSGVIFLEKDGLKYKLEYHK
jgi:type III secretion system YscD/HrpQ family protein